MTANWRKSISVFLVGILLLLPVGAELFHVHSFPDLHGLIQVQNDTQDDSGNAAGKNPYSLPCTACFFHAATSAVSCSVVLVAPEPPCLVLPAAPAAIIESPTTHSFALRAPPISFA